MARNFHISQSDMPKRNKIKQTVLDIANTFAKMIAWIRPFKKIPHKQNIKKILLCNGAHLGDMLIFESVIPMVRKNYPYAEIGVLVGSWGLPIIGLNQEIKHIHIVDHFMMNRSPTSKWKKVFHYLKTRHKSLGEIRKIRYDVAIDTYYFLFNSEWLLWQSGIPVRIGYDAGGFPSLLTEVVNWENKNQHVLDYHLDLLRRIPGEWPAAAESYSLQNHITSEEKEHILNKHGLQKKEYTVLHPGSGAAFKEWPTPRWQELVNRLIESGEFLVFTGRGEREEKIIKNIMDDSGDSVLNLSDQLDMTSLITILENAKTVFCVDSLVSHISAAMNSKTIVIYSGITNPYQWSPIGKKVSIIRKDISCSPCYKKTGCESMDCIRKVTVDDVLTVL